MEQPLIHVLIDSRFGPIAASADLTLITAKLVELTTKESHQNALVNPGSYRIKSVPEVTTAILKIESDRRTLEGSVSDQT